MNGLMLFSLLVFLGGLLSFGLRGLPAHDRLHDATQELTRRQTELEDTLAATGPVSWRDLSRLEDELRDHSRRVDARLALLLESPGAEASPDLTRALEDTALSELAPGQELRTLVETLGRRDTLTRDGLASLIEALARHEVFALESLEETAPAPVPGIERLQSWSAEVIVVAEVEEALELLEDLTPRPGSPVLSVSNASLRRIAPGLWPEDPTGLTTPPVRLWMRVEALARAPEDTP